MGRARYPVPPPRNAPGGVHCPWLPGRLGLASYQKSGTISGVRLPSGLPEGGKLPEPVFTPTTKAASGDDEPLTYAETASEAGEETAAELRRLTLEIYRRGAVWPHSAASSLPTQNSSSAGRPTGPSSSPTRC